MSRRATLGAISVLLCVLVAVAVGASASGSIAGSAHLPIRHFVGRGTALAKHARPPSGTFVSLVPACACGRHTQLDLFSVSSGRMLRELAAVSLDGYQQLATPAATNDGRLFFTYTSGARCAPKGDYIECPRFAPDSCRNAVKTLSEGQTRPEALFTVPGSQSMTGEAVPNPDGAEVALTLTPCSGTHGTTGLFVRDLKSGATHTILRSGNPCDGFGPAAWSPKGKELVFPLDRANGRPITIAGGIGCPGGRSYLALAPAVTASRRGALKLIHPGRGCIFKAAAFDRVGIVAVEGCDRGDPHHGVGSYLGNAYLLQYRPDGQLRMRMPLKLGLEQAVIATEPSTHDVLITQDQPANEPYPERDWLWEFDGHQLRPIAHYEADDATQILAIPW